MALILLTRQDLSETHSSVVDRLVERGCTGLIWPESQPSSFEQLFPPSSHVKFVNELSSQVRSFITANEVVVFETESIKQIEDAIKIFEGSFVILLCDLSAAGENIPTAKDNGWKPKQSCDVTGKAHPFIAVYHWPNQTRKDTLTRFSVSEMAVRAGNGSICAVHFLKEIEFKLGKRPKYGA